MYEKFLLFFLEAIKIKRIVRSGWVYSGVHRSAVESVADHSYMVTLLTLILTLESKTQGKKIDLEKALIMAVLHDLSESVSQDIDRRIRKFSPKKYDVFKQELDKNALIFLLENLPEEIKFVLLEIFEEFQKGESLEAKLVIEADRLETLIQLTDYRLLGIAENNFNEFYENFKQGKDNYNFLIIRKIVQKLLEGEQ